MVFMVLRGSRTQLRSDWHIPTCSRNSALCSLFGVTLYFSQTKYIIMILNPVPIFGIGLMTSLCWWAHITSVPVLLHGMIKPFLKDYSGLLQLVSCLFVFFGFAIIICNYTIELTKVITEIKECSEFAEKKSDRAKVLTIRPSGLCSLNRRRKQSWMLKL